MIQINFYNLTYKEIIQKMNDNNDCITSKDTYPEKNNYYSQHIIRDIQSVNSILLDALKDSYYNINTIIDRYFDGTITTDIVFLEYCIKEVTNKLE